MNVKKKASLVPVSVRIFQDQHDAVLAVQNEERGVSFSNALRKVLGRGISAINEQQESLDTNEESA